MIDSKKIESIVIEVIKQLEKDRDVSKPKLLVIAKDKQPVDKEIHQLEAYWKVIKAVPQDRFDCSDVQQALFLNMDQDTLVRVALGLTDTPESKVFTLVITKQIPISIVPDQALQKLLKADKEEHRYTNYIKKMSVYKETVERFGVSFKRLEDIKPIKHPASKTSETFKKLITLADIENFTGHKLAIKPGTIMTPLAKDKARERGIAVTFLKNI